MENSLRSLRSLEKKYPLETAQNALSLAHAVYTMHLAIHPPDHKPQTDCNDCKTKALAVSDAQAKVDALQPK